MDRQRLIQERDDALAAAQASLAAAAPIAQADARRPGYHFTARAQWINDPNGFLHHRGQYHLFYQHHPHSDRWDSMHWGHARSRDLVHWEHRAVALWPSRAQGEDHCFSGSAVIAPDGHPLAFYTSIAARREPQQWIAVGDPDLETWEKHPANPALTLAAHGGLEVEDWRDPYVFREGAWWYMVVGGHLRGQNGCVFLYRSADLLKWEFVGVPFGGSQSNFECPNLFRLDGRWVLWCSPYASPCYWVGDLDLAACRFTPLTQGTIDTGHYYAPTSTLDALGRRVMLGWIMPWPGGRGWSGCMSLPRVLGLDASLRLTQTPVPELASLRRRHQAAAPRRLAAGEMVRLDGLGGDLLEIEIDLELDGPAASAGLRLLASSDGLQGIDAAFGGSTLDLAGRVAQADPPQSLAHPRVTLRLFIDRSVVEIYAPGFPCVSQIVLNQTRPGDQSLFLFARGGGARVHRLDAWTLDPA